MNLLFDQNISFRIIKILPEEFKGSIHISSAGLKNSSDHEIWNFARKMGYSIVTFDADFVNIATLKGHPPKILIVKTGNRTTAQIASLLIDNVQLIKAFLENESYNFLACLEISD